MEFLPDVEARVIALQIAAAILLKHAGPMARADAALAAHQTGELGQAFAIPDALLTSVQSQLRSMLGLHAAPPA